jgi:hypothetical protein
LKSGVKYTRNLKIELVVAIIKNNMISRAEHIKQIERFHDLLEAVDKRIIDNEGKNLDDLMKYFELTSKVWNKIDNCIDDVKHLLDRIERENGK